MTYSGHPLLVVERLSVSVRTSAGDRTLVDDVSLALEAGSTLAIVGESGSGKTMTAGAIMGILPESVRASGSIAYRGRQLLSLSAEQRRKLSGPSIGYIFQEAMSALHPMLTIEEQMTRPMREHLRISRRDARSRAEGLLEEVGISRDREVLRSYVHELSGGMRQRVMIAIAISCGPDLLLADEPTTALDATVQKQILELLLRLRTERSLGLILISHDLGLVSRYADSIAVMLDGRIREHGRINEVLTSPRDLYTRQLINAAPRIGQSLDRLPELDRTAFSAPENRGTPHVHAQQ